MTELAYMPRTLIALACSLANFNVFLSKELPVYVRDEEFTWKGYMKFDEHAVIVTAPTLAQLQKDMEKYYETFKKDSREDRDNGTLQQEAKENNGPSYDRANS